MSSIFYSKKLKYLDNEYMFQTTYNEADHTAACSLFKGGRVVDINFVPLEKGIDNEEIVKNIMTLHDRRVKDYEALLKVTESTIDTDRAEIVIRLAKALLANKLFDEALDILQSASRKHSDNSMISLLLGKVYSAKGDLENAEIELKKAADLSPEFPDVHNTLGETYLRLKKPLAAIEQFERAVNSNVYYHRAFYNIGLGYVLNGLVREDFELARDIRGQCEKAFGKALAINPAYGDENYKNGFELLSEGKFAEAYEKFSSNTAFNGSVSPLKGLFDMYFTNVYGNELTSEENIKKYIEKIDELLRSNPGYADLENELGMAYTIMGKIMRDKAISHFKKATEINPSFERALKNIKLSEYDLKGFNALLEAILK